MDDLMRAELATPQNGLTCCWAGRPNWFFHHMCIGEEIGESARTTQNNINGLYLPTDTYSYLDNNSNTQNITYDGSLYVNLMGDPTLRLLMEPPPQELVAQQIADHAVQLTWVAPAEDPTALQGYTVYRVTMPYGPATRIDGGTGNTFVTNTEFTDSNPVPGPNFYMVRAVTRETSTSSSYYNASEGVITTYTPVFLPPTTLTQHYDVGENNTLTITTASGVLTGDTSAGGDPLTAAVANAPANGTLTLNSDGSFKYTPTTGFNGLDSFTYTANDGFATSAPTNVTILVHSLPTAMPGNYAIAMNHVLTVAAPGVLGKDSDVQGDPLTAIPAVTTTLGTLTLNPNGSFTYTPNPFVYGTDHFSYQSYNGYCSSTTATVTILVDVPPSAYAYSYATNQGTPLSVNAANGVLSKNNVAGLTAVVINQPAHGTLALNQNDGSFVYTPAPGFALTDTFTYQAYDGHTYSATGTVTITVNPVPSVTNVSYMLNAGATLTVAAPGVLAYDSDVDKLPLTAGLASNPTNGTVTLNTDGSFTYTPAAGFHGQDSFTYTASITTSNNVVVPSPPATVSLLVNAIPVAASQTYTAKENTLLSVPAATGVLNQATDADSGPDALTAVLVNSPAHGTLTLNPTGAFTYTPVTGYFGPDSFTYEAFDGEAYSNIATVNLVVIGPPSAGAANYTTIENIPLPVVAPGVLKFATDANNLPLTLSSATDVNGMALPLGKLNYLNVGVLSTSNSYTGTLLLNTDGSFTYTPAPGFISTDVGAGVKQDSFYYVVTNGTFPSTAGLVTITVNPNPKSYKGDVTPLPNGNKGSVDIDDWTQVGRFVAGLDTPANPSEALRAHCKTSSNAPLNITDWMQAANFAAGLLPLQYVNTVSSATGVAATRLMTTHTTTRVSLGNLTLARGARGTVPIVLTALGNEEALGFTVNYDARRLRLLSVTPVGAAAGAHLQLNNTGASHGEVGVLLMLPQSSTFRAGNATVLQCTFTVLPGALPGSAPLTFSDTVVTRAISDSHANLLTSTMSNGAIFIKE